MRDLEAFARDAFDIGAGKLVAWCKPDGMHQHLEPVPVLAERIHHGIDLLVTADVQRIGELRTEFCGEFLDTRLQLVVLVGKRKLRAFAVECLGDTPCNRAITSEPDDKRALSGHESHCVFPFCLAFVGTLF